MCLRRPASLMLCSVFIAAFSTATLYGQQAASESAGDNATAASGAQAEPGNQKESENDLWERLIYLPYKNLKAVLDKHGATVVVPYLDYLKLWERSAGGMRPTPGGPPIPAVITQSRYQARIDGDLARIEATLTIQVLGKPWAQIPLRFGGAAVGGVDGSDGGPPPGGRILLQGTGDGTYSLLLPEPGEHTVRLELLTPVRTSPEGRSFQLDCPPVGMTTLDLTIPEPDQTIEVTPHLVSLPVEAAGNSSAGADASGPGPNATRNASDQTRIRASLGATNRITARWHPRAGLKPEMALLVRVENLLNVYFEEGLAHTDAALHYQVLRGELNQLQIVVPKGHRILDVSAAEAQVKGWRAVEEEKRQLVTVDLLSPIREAITLQVHTEAPISVPSPRTPLPEGEGPGVRVAGIDEDGTVHGIHALDVVREDGQIAVTADKDLSLTIERQQGVVRMEEGSVAESLRRPGSLYYKFYSPNIQFAVAVRPVEPRIAVQQQAQLIFREDELQLIANLAYQVEKAGIFELRLRLPENLILDGVTSKVMADSRYDDETRVLTVILDQKRQGEIPISIRAHRPLGGEGGTGSAGGTQVLPLPEPLGVYRETGSVYVYAPEAIEVITDDAAVVGVHPEPAANAPQLPDVQLASAWSYSRRPVEIPVRTERKPTRLTAKVGTTINVRQELIEVETLLEYLVEHAGVTTFRFQVPEPVADRVRIEPVNQPSESQRDSMSQRDSISVRQVSRAEQAEDGWVTWTVVMQQDVLGRQRFRVRWDFKPDTGGEAENPNGEARPETGAGKETGSVAVTVQPLRPLGLEGEEETDRVPLSGLVGEVAVVKDRALSVSASAEGGDVEPIDVRELEQLPQSGSSPVGTTLAYRYHQGPVEITLTAAKHEIQPVVKTVISKALVEAVVGRDGTVTYRCRYRIKSSERQRLRVDLPVGFEPLGVFVDGGLVNLESAAAEPERQRRPDESLRAGAPATAWEAFFINVARTKSSEEPFSLTLQFRRDVPNTPFQHAGGVLQIPLPRIGGAPSEASPSPDGEAGGVVVQRLRSVVWVPERFWLVGTPDRFVRESYFSLSGLLRGHPNGPEQADDLEQWIGTGAPAFFDFPTEGHQAYRFSSLGAEPRLQIMWWDAPFLTWVLSGAVFLIAIALRNTPWENKLGFVLFVAFVAALFALEDADLVLHALTAARFGIAALLALWLIHALTAGRPEPERQRRDPSAEIGSTSSPVGTPLVSSGGAVVVPPPGVFEELSEQK